jgi:hypothetical protein
MSRKVEPGREEIAAFLASLKKLRDGLDNFNCQLAAIDGAGMRLGLLCQETAAACPAAAAALAQRFSGAAGGKTDFYSLGGSRARGFSVTARRCDPASAWRRPGLRHFRDGAI